MLQSRSYNHRACLIIWKKSFPYRDLARIAFPLSNAFRLYWLQPLSASLCATFGNMVFRSIPSDFKMPG